MRYSYLFLFLLLPGLVLAHKPSDSYLTVHTGDAFNGRLDVALRDLEHVVGLDINGDRAITWNELRQREQAVWAYVRAHLQLRSASGEPCPLTRTSYQVARHSDGAYASLAFGAGCEAPTALSYNLLFDSDPLHRGLLRVDDSVAVLAPEAREYRLDTAPSVWRLWVDYVGQGIWHVLIGLDHVLFLLLLILPAAGHSRPGGARVVLWDVVKVVTAFTIAHSITLSLATLGYLQFPSRWVEAGIAASIVFAAVNNLYPILGRRRWLLAFGFGLIHGLGFASVLADLGLPTTLLAMALIAFNIGVEAGQLALVVLVLPLLLHVRRTGLYRGVLFPAGSATAGIIGFVWLVERLG